MQLKHFFCLILMTLMLNACGPVYKTTYTYVPPHGSKGKMCTMQCQQSKSLCQRLCDSDYRNCATNARQDARFRYEEYLSERRAQGKTAEKTLDNFYSTYECERQSCGCNDDYRSCFQMCGGQVIPHQTCVAFCDQQ